MTTDTTDIVEEKPITLSTLVKQDHHYFISSFDIWVVGDDLSILLKRFWKETRSDYGEVWLVPAPLDAKYGISMWQPRVDGAKLIAQVYRSQKARDKADK